MTESPLKEKIKQAFIENDRLQEKISVAIDKLTTSGDRLCKRIAKMCEVFMHNEQWGLQAGVLAPGPHKEKK